VNNLLESPVGSILVGSQCTLEISSPYEALFVAVGAGARKNRTVAPHIADVPEISDFLRLPAIRACVLYKVQVSCARPSSKVLVRSAGKRTQQKEGNRDCHACSFHWIAPFTGMFPMT
jgi:hypothetical protein